MRESVTEIMTLPLMVSTEPVPMLDLRANYSSIRGEIRAAIDAVLDSQHFILGTEVRKLEEEVARYCGRKFAVGVASGTDALILSLHACGVGPGDEVIVPAFSFIATADSVSLLGATPVFVDIEPDTYTIDPTKIPDRITPRCKAIVPVHLYGHPADMDPILELAQEHGLKVIEDNAQGFGAAYKGRETGNLGHFGCISFFPSKNLGGYGDGGMILTEAEDSYQRLVSLRSHGSVKKYYSEEQGWNSRLDELQAAVLRVKLRHIDQWNGQRRANAARYDSLLREIPGIVIPRARGWAEHIFHQYTIRVPERDRVQKSLADQGIASTVYYPTPIHLQRVYSQLGYKPGDLPECERAAKEVLSLPMYPELADAQIERVVGALARAMQLR